MKDAGGNKRQRVASPDGLQMVDLPESILSHAATYLAPPSRALFAVAMTASSISWQLSDWERQPTPASKAIIGNVDQWDTLDFGDVEESLAGRLHDADLGGILQCIGALNNLKVLKLTNCNNIEGKGLDPLIGSTVLEDVDLSIVGDDVNLAHEHVAFSEARVAGIFASFVETPWIALRHYRVPRMVRDISYSIMSEGGVMMKRCPDGGCSGRMISLGLCASRRGQCKTCSNKCIACENHVCMYCFDTKYKLCKSCKDIPERFHSAIVMSQVGCSWNDAISALVEHDGDMVNAVMALLPPPSVGMIDPCRLIANNARGGISGT